MGGMGSGRRYQGGRSTTEDYRPLDVRKLHKAGLLAAGRGGMWNWYSRGERRASITQRQASASFIRCRRQERPGCKNQKREILQSCRRFYISGKIMA